MSRFSKLEFSDDNKPPVVNDDGSAKRYNNTAADWFHQAEEKRHMGLNEAALRLYSRALENDRSLVTCWVEQVRMLILLNEPRQAEIWANSALKQFPNHGDLLAARAQATVRMGDRGNAMQYSDAAMQSGGDSAYRWMVRGELMHMTRSKSVTHCFDSAKQLCDDWLVRTDIANILLYHRAPAVALQYATDAVTLASDAPFAWLVKARCEFAAGLSSKATQSVKASLQLLSGYVEAEQLLRKIQNDSGFFQRIWRRLKN